MSKIIKKARFTAPVILPTMPAPSSFGSSPGSNARSLNFTRSAREEIGAWRSRFEKAVGSGSSVLEHKLRDADRRGYERGFEDGVAHEREDHIAMIDSLLREAKRRKEEAIRDLEIKVVDLAVRIAERIIARTFDARPQIVLDIVREAMTLISGGDTVILKVSEDDHPMVNERYEEWLGMSGSAREFRIESDRRLRRGDCLIETEGGIIDAVLANRLDFLVEELLKHS